MQGLKQKKNPELELFSRVGVWLQGWTHTQGYLAFFFLKEHYLNDFP